MAKNNFMICLTNTDLPVPSKDVIAVIKQQAQKFPLYRRE